MAAGGGGSSGAGKETAGATTLSDLNNFQFQEGKRELEKYRRRDLAEGREEAPKGSRVCGGASLDTAKKAGEQEPEGVGGGTACLEEPLFRRVAVAGRGGRARAGTVEVDGPAAARLPPPRPRRRPVSTASGWAHPAPGGPRPGSLAPPLPAPARNHCPREARFSPPWQIAAAFLAADSFPAFLSPSSVAFLLSFLSFSRSSCS